MSAAHGLDVLGQQFVDAHCGVASGDDFEGYLEVGEGFDIVDLRCRDDGPCGLRLVRLRHDRRRARFS